MNDQEAVQPSHFLSAPDWSNDVLTDCQETLQAEDPRDWWIPWSWILGGERRDTPLILDSTHADRLLMEWQLARTGKVSLSMQVSVGESAERRSPDVLPQAQFAGRQALMGEGPEGPAEG